MEEEKFGSNPPFPARKKVPPPKWHDLSCDDDDDDDDVSWRLQLNLSIS